MDRGDSARDLGVSAIGGGSNSARQSDESIAEARVTDRAATRVSPRVLDITEKRGTFGVFTCRLSEGGAQSVLYSGPGSAQDLKRRLQVSADPDLVVVSLTQGVGLDLIAPTCEVPAAPRVLLATDWVAIADSLGGGYWTPQDPERRPAIARVYFEDDALIQVELHRNAAGEPAIRCPTPVYIWIPADAAKATRTGLRLLAKPCAPKRAYAAAICRI